MHAVFQGKGKGPDGAAQDLAGLRLSTGSASPPPALPPAKPPRPAAPVKERIDYESPEEEDENDPFGDSNALETPGHEKDEPRW